MSNADGATPLTAAEAGALFADLSELPILVLAVSGGPDSTSLLILAAQWRKSLKKGPKLVAVTVDHGLREAAKNEAKAVGKLARKLGVAHRILRWNSRKPTSGIQEAARLARYGLLAKAARTIGAQHVLTAHTLDDQAETVLFRLARGSGIGGLGAMARDAALPGDSELRLIRPLLGVPKARLIATLRKARVAFADDPTNRDPHFTRPRLRAAMPLLEREGLSAQRLALLARRARRVDAALEATVDDAWTELAHGPWPVAGPFAFPVTGFSRLPAEVSLRLLGRAIGRAGSEGPVELGKLEALHAQLSASEGARFRRTLAGAVVTRSEDDIVVERAPERRSRARIRP